MFVQQVSDVARPYHRLCPALIDSPNRLPTLAVSALHEALESTSRLPCPSDQVMECLRCQIAPLRLHTDALTVPVRWVCDLDAVVFPQVLDADLHVFGLGSSYSRLFLQATYPRPTPPAKPDAIHDTVQAAIDAYLGKIATMLRREVR